MPVNVDHGPLAGVVRLVVLGVRVAHQGKGANLHLVAETHLLLFIQVEGQTGEADHDDDEAEVHQVSAVTARVAARDGHHAVEDVLPGLARNDAPTAPELAHYRRRHQNRQRDRHQRVKVRDVLPWTHTADHEPDRGQHCQNCGP